MLMRMYRNWNPCAQLLGMENNGAALGHSMEVP